MIVCELLQGKTTASRGYEQSRAPIFSTISLTIALVSFESNQTMFQDDLGDQTKELHTILEVSGIT